MMMDIENAPKEYQNGGFARLAAVARFFLAAELFEFALEVLLLRSSLRGGLVLSGEEDAPGVKPFPNRFK